MLAYITYLHGGSAYKVYLEEPRRSARSQPGLIPAIDGSNLSRFSRNGHEWVGQMYQVNQLIYLGTTSLPVLPTAIIIEKFALCMAYLTDFVCAKAQSIEYSWAVWQGVRTKIWTQDLCYVQSELLEQGSPNLLSKGPGCPSEEGGGETVAIKQCLGLVVSGRKKNYIALSVMVSRRKNNVP